MKQFVLILIFLLGYFTISLAQEAAESIRGVILTEESLPLELANVALLSTDSVFLQGTCSREDGQFEIHPIKPGNYILQISCLGYRTVSHPYTTGDTGKWILVPEAFALTEVAITAQRPVYRLKAGKLEAAVQNTLLASLSNANEVLKHVPGLHSSEEGFTVFGRGTPVIYIDNHPLRDPSELERLSATDIEKIELISNPGAEYDATVKAVIRIRTIRNKRDGIGTELRATVSQGKRLSHSEQVTLNYRKQGLSLQGTGYYFLYNGMRGQDVRYEIPSTVQWDIYSDNQMRDKSHPFGATANLGYDVNDNHSFGVAYEFYRTPSSSLINWSDLTIYANGTWNDRTDFFSENFQQDDGHRLNAYYQGKVKQFQMDFTADAVSGRAYDHQESRENSQTEGLREVSSFTHLRNSLYAAKLVLTHPLWKGDLKAGADYTFLRRKDNYNNPQNILPNTDSQIDESKVAGFVEYSLALGKVNLLAGLRFEHAVSDYWNHGNHIAEQSRHYNDWLPNFSIDLPVGKVQTNLAYTVKTNRPSFFQLRRTISYNNRFIYETGNPLLIPETYHDVQLTGLYKWVQFTASYQHRVNAISFTTQEYEDNPDVAVFTQGNFKKLQYLRGSIHLSPTINIWKPELGVYFTQPFFDVENQGKQKSMNRPSIYINWNNSLKLPADFIFSFGIDYTSGGNFGAMLQRSYWGMDAGIRRTFLDKKLTVNLQASDLLNTRKGSFMLFGPKLTYSKQAYPDSRMISLTVSYRIDSGHKAYKGKHVSEEDINRL